MLRAVFVLFFFVWSGKWGACAKNRLDKIPAVPRIAQARIGEARIAQRTSNLNRTKNSKIIIIDINRHTCSLQNPGGGKEQHKQLLFTTHNTHIPIPTNIHGFFIQQQQWHSLAWQQQELVQCFLGRCPSRRRTGRASGLQVHLPHGSLCASLFGIGPFCAD